MGTRDPEVGVGSRLISDLVAQHYQRLLPLHATGRLLDLGCGNLPLYQVYRSSVHDVICVDWTANRHLDFQCDLTKSLPFADGEFDTIILSDVLEHIPNPENLWHEMSRILAPDGKVILNVPFYYWIHEPPYDFHRYTSFALERMVELSGLNVILLEPIGGLVEVAADIGGKTTVEIPFFGRSLSVFLQRVAFRFSNTARGRGLLNRTARHFPLGYFLVAHKALKQSGV